MKEKEKIIIETAIKLFAHKGVSSTSIQEIATESGISKGAFYLYFKSKDALLLAILTYYFNRLQKNIQIFENLDLPPREKFAKQLTALFETLLTHKEFIIMQAREQAIPLNESVQELIFKMHTSTHQFYMQSLQAIYGDAIKNHIWDLSLLLDGMFQSYLKLMIVDDSQISLTDFTQFMLRRMDDLVAGITNDTPLVTRKEINHFLNKTKAFLTEPNKITHILQQLKKEITVIENNEDLIVSFEVLEAETKKEVPRTAVIQGMLSNFNDYPSLAKLQKKIASYFQLKE